MKDVRRFRTLASVALPSVFLPLGIWFIAPVRHGVVVALFLAGAGLLFGATGYAMARAREHLLEDAGYKWGFMRTRWSLEADDYEPDGRIWLRRYWILFASFALYWLAGSLLVRPFATHL